MLVATFYAAAAIARTALSPLRHDVRGHGPNSILSDNLFIGVRTDDASDLSCASTGFAASPDICFHNICEVLSTNVSPESEAIPCE